MLRARGVPLDQAIDEACRTRLRPILMTTSAIIAGLLPTALGLGIGGAQRSAIAVTIVGGQSLCLFLTLLLVPAAYVKLDALEQSMINQRFQVDDGWCVDVDDRTPAGRRTSRLLIQASTQRPQRPPSRFLRVSASSASSAFLVGFSSRQRGRLRLHDAGCSE